MSSVEITEFIVGVIIGEVIATIVMYLYFKERCKKERADSYERGIKIGSEREKQSILEYIESLAKDPNTCIYQDESSEGDIAK